MKRQFDLESEFARNGRILREWTHQKNQDDD